MALRDKMIIRAAKEKELASSLTTTQVGELRGLRNQEKNKTHFRS